MGSIFGGGSRRQRTSSAPAPWVEQASQRGVQYAENQLQNPMQAYQGARVAQMTDAERNAGRMAAQDRYSPLIGQSQEAYGRVGEISSRRSTEGLQDYINPYTKNVLDISNRELGRSYDQARSRLQGQAASRGAFGGSRQALLESGLERNFLQSQGDLYSRGMADAYDRAMSANQADLTRAGQGALAEASGYGNLAGQYADMTNDQIRALMATGETERGIAQGALDADYEAYLRGQAQQTEALDRYLASIRAGDYSRTGTVSGGGGGGLDGALGLASTAIGLFGGGSG